MIVWRDSIIDPSLKTKVINFFNFLFIMTKEEPKVSASGKYELREAAKALDVSPSTIQKWRAAGKIKCGTKRVNGRKFWTGREILRVWTSCM